MTISHEKALARTIVLLLAGDDSVRAEDVVNPCLWHLAKANQLLLAVGDMVESRFDKQPFPAPYFERYQKLKRLNAHTQTLMAELLPAFSDADLPILTIKSFLPFPFADSNVDVVTLLPNRAQSYVDLLQKRGFEHWFNLADWREPRKKMYGRPDWKTTDEPFPTVHLHRAISWNGVDYLDLTAVAKRQQTRQIGNLPIPIPAPEDELLIMAAHAFFENKFITLHELIYLEKLIQNVADWNIIFATANQYNWRSALTLFLSIAVALAKEVGLSIEIPHSLSPTSDLKVQLPFVLPVSQTYAVSWQKLGQDLQAGQWRQFPRQLFTYSFVDAAWMYRKVWRKQRRKKQAMASC